MWELLDGSWKVTGAPMENHSAELGGLGFDPDLLSGGLSAEVHTALEG